MLYMRLAIQQATPSVCQDLVGAVAVHPLQQQGWGLQLQLQGSVEWHTWGVGLGWVVPTCAAAICYYPQKLKIIIPILITLVSLKQVVGYVPYRPEPHNLIPAQGRVGRVSAVLRPKGEPLDTDDGIDAPSRRV